MRRLTPDLTDRPLAAGAGVEVLPPCGEDSFAPLVQEDLEATRRGAASFGADWVVVDHYAAREDYLRGLANLGVRLCVLDDLLDRRLDAATLIVSLELSARPEAYRGVAPERVLRGPHFVPVHPVFRARREQALRDRRFEEPLRRVLVVLGSAGSLALAARVVARVRAEAPEAEVRVILNLAQGEPPALEWAAAERVRVLPAQAPESLAQLMAWCDLAVATASTIALEMASLGVPMLLTVLADNQRAAAQDLVAAGAARGFAADFDAGTELLGDLRAASVRRALSARAAALNDARGAERVCAALRQGMAVPPPAPQPRFALRRAQAIESDLQALFEWRNDPVTVAMSKTEAPVKLTTHRAWFRKLLRDRARIQFVAEWDGVLCGAIRFDRLDATSCLVSVVVAPSFRGRRLASPLIAEGSRRVFAEWPELRAIYGEIREDNEASRRAFAQCGYRPQSVAAGGKRMSEPPFVMHVLTRAVADGSGGAQKP